MRRIPAMILLLLAVGLVGPGCSTLTIRHPVGEPVRDEEGQELTGMWCEAAGGCWNLRYRTAGVVELTSLSPRSPSVGAGVLTEYGGQYYLHIQQGGAAPEALPEYSLFLLRGRARGRGVDVLHLWEPREPAFREAIEAGGLEGSEGMDVKVTASKAAMEAFLKSHSPADLFDLDSPWTFVKQPGETLAAWERSQAESDRFLVAFAKTALAMLGYATGPLDGEMDPLTALQVKKFQRWQSLPATGAVDAATFLELWEAWSLAVPPVTTLPTLSVEVGGWEMGYVRAWGTWQRPEICPALFPAEQTTTIACYRQRGICIAGTAAIRPLGENVRLDVAPDFWNIESWDEHEIRATRGAVPPCGDKESLHIERASRTVTKQRLQGDGQTPGEFQSLSSTPLVDGKEVTKRQEAQRRERLLDLAKRFGAIDTPTMLPRE